MVVAVAIAVVTSGGIVGVVGALPNGGSGPGAAGEAVTTAGSVQFSNQTSGGTTVTVDRVTVPESGFVTIHDSSLLDGDAIGSVVGTSEYLPAGTHEDVEIDVSGVEGTDTPIAMPHRDTNGNEAYDFVEQEGGADGPYLGPQGAVVVAAEVEFPVEETTTATTTQAGDMETTAMDDTETTMDGANGTTAEEGDGGSPGLGVVAALGALLALLALWRARR